MISDNLTYNKYLSEIIQYFIDSNIIQSKGTIYLRTEIYGIHNLFKTSFSLKLLQVSYLCFVK